MLSWNCSSYSYIKSTNCCFIVEMVCGFPYLNLTLIILLGSKYVLCFEPISTISLGVASMGAMYAGWQAVKCRFGECCDTSWISNNFTNLDLAFQTQLFGQHIAHKVVLNALKDHFREGAKPKKALALSFHGWPGSGKTYVSQLIVENLFKEGAKSKFVRFFMARTHFMVEKHADIYKIHLMDWIRGNVSLCARSIFIFDEVDKLPRGVLDAVKPFLDYHEHIDGIDYRKAVFIFLSNTGSNLIVKRLIEKWEAGTYREDIHLRDFEDLIRRGAFNEEGGFHKSETIDSNLIDHYVPFLPMEQIHVRMCIEEEFKRRGHQRPKEEHIQEVLNDLTFGPSPQYLYSNSGCKRVSSKVGNVMEKVLFNMYRDEMIH